MNYRGKLQQMNPTNPPMFSFHVSLISNINILQSMVRKVNHEMRKDEKKLILKLQKY